MNRRTFEITPMQEFFLNNLDHFVWLTSQGYQTSSCQRTVATMMVICQFESLHLSSGEDQRWCTCWKRIWQIYDGSKLRKKEEKAKEIKRNAFYTCCRELARAIAIFSWESIVQEALSTTPWAKPVNGIWSNYENLSLSTKWFYPCRTTLIWIVLWN